MQDPKEQFSIEFETDIPTNGAQEVPVSEAINEDRETVQPVNPNTLPF